MPQESFPRWDASRTDYNPFSLDNDIAILQLSESVPDVTPSPIFRDVPIVGEVLVIVGFGANGTAADGSDGSFGVKHSGTTFIDEVQDTLIIWKFDDETESNTAAGDSGGPGFLNLNGELMIACVTSGGTEPNSELGDCAFYTRVDAYASWIDTRLADESIASEESEGCHYSGEPFPLLRFLIYFLTALYDYLTDQLGNCRVSFQDNDHFRW